MQFKKNLPNSTKKCGISVSKNVNRKTMKYKNIVYELFYNSSGSIGMTETNMMCILGQSINYHCDAIFTLWNRRSIIKSMESPAKLVWISIMVLISLLGLHFTICWADIHHTPLYIIAHKIAYHSKESWLSLSVKSCHSLLDYLQDFHVLVISL